MVTKMVRTSSRMRAFSLQSTSASSRWRSRGRITSPQNLRQMRSKETTKPQGAWAKRWVDPVHESEGHDIDGLAECRIGEGHLYNGMMSLYADNGIEYAVDDISGSLLDPAAVHEGRSTEMGFFEKLKVYDRVPREEQRQTGGKVIGTKWIDVNKGDADHPNIRCRLVGK